MKTKIKLFNFGLWLLNVFLLVACGFTTPEDASRTPNDVADIVVPSLHDIYPDLMEQALRWDSQAALNKVIIDVFPSMETDFRDISAIFQTSRDNQRFLYVEHSVSDEIITSEGAYSLDTGNQNRIITSLQDTLDSTDAFAIFIRNPKVYSQKYESFRCAELILLLNNDGRSLQWRLAIGGRCGDTDRIYFHIDAYTGQWQD